MKSRSININAKAFTLIELLIVVAIIAILAAIAVPNFLEAQVRAKVSRAKTDMRSMATAVECYAVDNNKYPYSQLPVTPAQRDWVSPGGFPLGNVSDPNKMCGGMTTPIAYITSLPIDIFDTKLPPRDSVFNALHYIGTQFGYDRGATPSTPMPVFVPTDSANGSVGPMSGTGPDVAVRNGVNGRVPAVYTLYSYGPDGVPFLDTNNDNNPDIQSVYNVNNLYDPTNGTVSPGNVIRLPGGAQ